MKHAPYNNWGTRNYDPWFEKLLKNILTNINKDDDFLLMCVGPTGCGKSALTMHAYEFINPEGCTVDNISFCPDDHANAMKNLMNKEGIRFIANDEANVQKRNSSTKYNKDLIDLYFSIRGLNFFHWWNNPSLDIIDKVFIREKINGVIYIADKSTKVPRTYVYFTKQAMLKIVEEHERITLDILKKSKHKYALYQGWFKDYKGKLLVDYKAKKKSRMEEKVTDFFDKYGNAGKYTKAQLAKEFIVAESTIFHRIKKLKEENNWIEGEDFICGQGKEFIMENGKNKLKSN